MLSRCYIRCRFRCISSQTLIALLRYNTLMKCTYSPVSRILSKTVLSASHNTVPRLTESFITTLWLPGRRPRYVGDPSFLIMYTTAHQYHVYSTIPVLRETYWLNSLGTLASNEWPIENCHIMSMSDVLGEDEGLPGTVLSVHWHPNHWAVIPDVAYHRNYLYVPLSPGCWGKQLILY